MATDKRRITFAIDDALYAEFETWMKLNNVRNMSLAINTLLRAGMLSPDKLLSVDDPRSEAIVIEAEPCLLEELIAYANENELSNLGDPAKELIWFGLLEMCGKATPVQNGFLSRAEMRLNAHFMTGTPEQRAAIIENVKSIIYPERNYSQRVQRLNSVLSKELHNGESQNTTSAEEA